MDSQIIQIEQKYLQEMFMRNQMILELQTKIEELSKEIESLKSEDK